MAFTFGERTFTFGGNVWDTFGLERTFTIWGTNVLLLGIIGVLVFFLRVTRKLNFFFCLLSGFWHFENSVGRGAP